MKRFLSNVLTEVWPIVIDIVLFLRLIYSMTYIYRIHSTKPIGIHPIYLPSADTSHKKKNRASLVAQWLRICLTMQRTRVRALVWEDPTCHGATRPVSRNY